MRVAIAGAGAVGRSVARELIGNGHRVLLIDKDPASLKPERVPDAEWLLADSCELSSLEEAHLDECDVVIAATGDDKVNGLTPLPENCALGTIRRDGRVNVPDPERPVESGDELLFVVPADKEDELERLLAPANHGG